MDIKHQSLILDVNKVNILPNIVAHQGDQKTRFIDVTLTMSGEEIMLNDSYRAILKASNNGDVKAINDCQIDLERNIIIVELTSTMLDTAGFLNCEITVVDGDKYITSQNFMVEVSISSVSEDEEIKTSKEYGTLVKLIEEVSKIENDAKVVKEIISHLAEIKDIDALVNSKADKEDVANQLAAKENISDKINTINFPSTTYYTSSKAVWDFVTNKLSEPLSDIENLQNTLTKTENQLNILKIKNTTPMTNNVVINDSSDSNIVDLMLQDSSAKVYLYGKNLAEFNSYFAKANGWTSGEIAEKIVVTKDTKNKTVTFNSVNESGRSGVNVMWKNSSVDYERLLTKTITISVDVLVTDDCTFFLCNSCDNYKSTTIKLKANKKQRVSVTTTMPSDISKIQNTSILFHIDSTKTNVTLSNFQIELNTTATSYEDYKNSQTVTSDTDLSTVHTNYPTTTIIADNNFQLTYIADTKNYIDNK